MPDPPTPRGATRLARGVNACQRCRRRKQKCDLKSPQCTNCYESSASCLVYNLEKQTEIPRDYLSSLEAQVAQLRQENDRLRVSTQTSPTQDAVSVHETPSDHHVDGATSTEGSQSWMVNSLGRLFCEPSNTPRFWGVSSGITLARLVMAAIRVENLPSSFHASHKAPAAQLVPPPTLNLSTVDRSPLPPRHVADHLVDVYFQHQTPHFPVIERPRVEEAVRIVYERPDPQSPPERDTSLFIMYMILAIALCDVRHPSGSHPPQSDDFFQAAIADMDQVFTYSRSQLETHRAILLICQYIALCPSKGSLWLLTGLALRLAVDLGLHWETEESKRYMDPALLNDRRRLWYATYLFDRLLCITLGRPFGISDGTNVELPAPHVPFGSDPRAVHARKAQNHLIRLAQLESEIKHVLYSNFRTMSLALPKANYAAWIHDIQPRLHEWYLTVPPPADAHPQSIFASQAYWDAMYNNTLLFLYRPNPIISQPSPEDLRLSFESSCTLIASIKDLHRERHIDIMWKWVYHLFMAGLTVLYGLWQSADIRDAYETNHSISTLQSCVSTLAALSERWPGATGCRDAFETLSAATVDWLITTNQEKMRQSRLHFETQLATLQQQLLPQPLWPADMGSSPSTGDAMAILSGEPFGFGESLSSAAHWPEFGYVDFDEFAF